MVAFDWVMRRTMMGKAMRAVAHDGTVASLMGINVTAVMIGAFFLSSALAGLSGFLIAPIASASLYVGWRSRSRASRARSSADCRNPRGCVLGGFVLGVLESLVNLWQAQWREIVVFLLVILVLAFRPYGLLGQERWRRYDAARASHHRRRRRAGAALRRLGNRQRLLPPHPLHDVRLLSVRGRA